MWQQEGFCPCQTQTSTVRVKVEACREKNGGCSINCEEWRVMFIFWILSILYWRILWYSRLPLLTSWVSYYFYNNIVHIIIIFCVYTQYLHNIFKSSVLVWFSQLKLCCVYESPMITFALLYSKLAGGYFCCSWSCCHVKVKHNSQFWPGFGVGQEKQKSLWWNSNGLISTSLSFSKSNVF